VLSESAKVFQGVFSAQPTTTEKKP